MHEKVAAIIADLDALGLSPEQRAGVLAHMLDIALTVRTGPANTSQTGDQTAASAMDKRRADDRARQAARRSRARAERMSRKESRDGAAGEPSRQSHVTSRDSHVTEGELPAATAGNVAENRIIATADLSRDVTRDASAPLLSFLERDSDSLKERKGVRGKRGGRHVTSRSTADIPLPPDWKPTAAHLAEGEALGFGRAQVVGQAEDMRLWALAHGAVKAGWDAYFSRWMRRNAAAQPGAGAQRSLPMLRPLPPAAPDPREDPRWTRVKQRLESDLGADVVESWFKSARFAGIDAGAATLALPTRFLRDWIAGHFAAALLAAWHAEEPGIERIEMVLQGKPARAPPPIAADVASSPRRSAAGDTS